MSMSTSWVALPGSERIRLPGARAVEPADPKEHILVTVVVHPKEPPHDRSEWNRLPRERHYLRREEFVARHGAAPDNLAAVETFARAHKLTVVESHPARRSVVLTGTVADFSSAFAVVLSQCEHSTGSYRGRSGPVHVPAELAPIITGVFGLDNRPQAQPHFRLAGDRKSPTQTAFTPLQVAGLYNFPAQGMGQGQTIAIIELGGGYTTDDLQTYFNGLGIPLPPVSSISVDGEQNSPTGDPTGADGEVMLDIEVAGAVAPEASLVVYFAPNTDQGFLDALTMAIHDTTNNPSVISISWGSAESNWTAQALTVFDQALTDAGHLGVTICVAAGDNGSANGVADGSPHVDFPASSPHVLACGGTKLQAGNGQISSEVVWNNNGAATGGGISGVFALPDYQKSAGVPGGNGRGVPDVAGHADLATGYIVRLDGQEFTIGGTSAVAPLWAGLITLINQQLGHSVGFLNPLLYQQAVAGTFHDITAGTNDVSNLGLYTAGPGWDPCTGQGSPDGQQLLTALNG